MINSKVVPVYEQFCREFPDVETLARANQEAVKKILHPLGLNRNSVRFT